MDDKVAEMFGEIRGSLGRIEQKVDGQSPAIADHETRIANLERQKNWLWGIGIGIVWLLGYVGFHIGGKK